MAQKLIDFPDVLLNEVWIDICEPDAQIIEWNDYSENFSLVNFQNSFEIDSVKSNNIFEKNFTIAEQLRVLTCSVNQFRMMMQDFFNENSMPLRWEILELKNQAILTICYENIKNSLNGDADSVNFILKCFNNEIYEFEETNLVGGIFKEEFCSKNSLMIISFNKNELDKLWNERIEKFLLKSRSRDFYEYLINEFETVKKLYFDERAFFRLEPEMTEAYEEWFTDKHIDSFFKYIINISSKN